MPKAQSHIDLVALIERYTSVRLARVANHFKDHDEFAGPCPWCGGTDRFHVWPHSERPHYNCVRGCRRNGDAIQLLIDYCDMTFVEACEELEIDIDDAIAEREMWRKSYNREDPPPNVWQDRAREFAHACIHYLWSNKGQEALEWLKARGFTDQTMKLAQLGYCPTFFKDTLENWGLSPALVNRDMVRIPEGIVIPWFAGKDIWKLAVRRLHPKENEPKYGQVVGSAEGLYNADAIRALHPAMMVEGEFDALSVLQEAGTVIACVATGSVSRGYTPRWVSLLSTASVLLQSFDAEEEGDEGAKRWLVACSQAMRWQPDAHDANDMLREGKDIRSWVGLGLEIATRPTPLQRESTNDDLSPVCSLCGAEVERYSPEGKAYCMVHYETRQNPLQCNIDVPFDEPPNNNAPPPQQTVLQAAEPVVIVPEHQEGMEVPSDDPLLCFAQTVAEIAKVFPGGCKIVRHDPNYTLEQHIATLYPKQNKRTPEDFWREVRAKLSPRSVSTV